MTRLSQKKLHELFLMDVRPCVSNIFDNEHKPLIFDMTSPIQCHVKAYIFNCTAPPGGRSIDEWKVQLILDNQKRKTRGHFDDSDGSFILIVGYAIPLLDENDGVWVLFELDKHKEFAYSANIQIYLRQILHTFTEDVFTYKKHNDETVILARRKHLVEAIETRYNVDTQIMIDKANLK